jgi:heat shock protein HslJ
MDEKPPVKELDQRLHDIWSLKSVDGVKAAPEQVSAYLEFNLTTNKVYGNTGCNSLSGDLIAKGDSIKLLNLTVTEKFCIGFENEQEYLNRLQDPMKFSLNGLELTLISNKSVLIFQKVD